MSDLRELLADCQAQGVRFELRGDGSLAVDAPRGRLTPAFVARLRPHKAAILALMATNPGAGEASDTRLETSAPVALDSSAESSLEHPADVERPGWGADGWPVDTVEPRPPCERCGGRDAWQTLPGAWRCLDCDPPTIALRLLADAARLRDRHATRLAGERRRLETANRSPDARTRPASV